MQNLLERLSTENFDPRITRRNLSYFFAAAKLGNFTEAAKVCGVAQPSLSRGIVLLEDAINAALFDRKGRNVVVTRKGIELLPKVELYLNQCLDFTATLGTRKSGVSSEIKVAAISSLTADLLPQLITRFEASNSGTKITLQDGINQEIVDAVDVGEVDIGIIITPEDPARFRSTELFSDQYCLAVDKGHRFYESETVRWEALKQEEIATFEKGSNTYDSIAAVFSSIGMFFNPAACVKFRNTLMGLVQHRGLVAILPKLVVQEEKQSSIRAIPLIDPAVRRTYYFLARKDRLQKEEIHELETFLRLELMAIEQLSG